MNWILTLKVITLLGYIAALATFLVLCSEGALSHIALLRLASPL